MKKKQHRRRKLKRVTNVNTEKMDYKKEIIKKINGISGRYSNYEVFTDFVKCAAISISNACEFTQQIWQSREKQYIETIKKYTKEEQKVFPELLALLTEALEEEIEDVLGAVYMQGNMGNKSTGQFFTPFHVSLICAEIAISEQISQNQKKWRLNEPSAGGGGMPIEQVAKMLGHESVETTQIYLDLTEDDLALAHQKYVI